MDTLTNVSMYIALQLGVLAVELLFPSLVSFVCSIVPVMVLMHRNMKTVKNYWLPKGGTIITSYLFINLLQIIF